MYVINRMHQLRELLEISILRRDSFYPLSLYGIKYVKECLDRISIRHRYFIYRHIYSGLIGLYIMKLFEANRLE